MLLERPDTGLLIGVEGVSGVGKTTICEELGERYSEVTATPDEPSHDLYTAIDTALEAEDDYYNRHGYPGAEGLLFMSQRLFELREFVQPALQQDKIVLHDRSFYSPCVYSTVLVQNEYPDEDRRDLFERFVALRSQISYRPDYNILLTDDAEECVERRGDRDGQGFDHAEQSFQRSVYDAFHDLLATQDDVTVVDVEGSDPSETAKRVAAAIDPLPEPQG